MGQSPAKITKQWADSPFPFIETPRKVQNITNLKSEPGSIEAATEMCLIHNVFIRILNCIYLQALNVSTEKDISDFAIFCHAWCVTIHEHHQNEETHWFPWIEKSIGVEGFMERNVEQHHAFNPGMEKFEQYVDGVMQKKEIYDGEKVVKLIDGFGTTLTDHLKDEVQTFVDLGKHESKLDWKVWKQMLQDIAVKTADTKFEIPIVMTNFDSSFEHPYHKDVWPPLPWFVSLMFRILHVPTHKGAWRFSSCDSQGRPKELEFV